MNYGIVQSIVEQALGIAAQYFPPAGIVGPLVMGIVTAIVHRSKVPVPEGETWTEEQIAAYRAEVIAHAQRVVDKLDVMGVLAAENKAQAIADAAAEAEV